MRFAVVVLVVVALCACGGGSGGSAPDASTAEQRRDPDAGPGDAGPVDAGPLDAGPVDAGDAGSPDDGDGGTLALRPSPIAEENQRAGGWGWHLDAATDQSAAYADRASALPAESMVIQAGAVSATTVTWQLWRMWY